MIGVTSRALGGRGICGGHLGTFGVPALGTRIINGKSHSVTSTILYSFSFQPTLPPSIALCYSRLSDHRARNAL